MRLTALCLTAAASLVLAAAGPRPAARYPGPAAAANQPPHAWLYGTWTGGLFPVLDGMTAQDCRTQPTVVFGRDAVGYASLLGTTMTQRVIATVRATPTGTEFTFTPGTAGGPGFDCPNPDQLFVSRATPDRVMFPDCKAFPYPLQRCG
jgi:hypothetical protein